MWWGKRVMSVWGTWGKTFLWTILGIILQCLSKWRHSCEGSCEKQNSRLLWQEWWYFHPEHSYAALKFETFLKSNVGTGPEEGWYWCRPASAHPILFVGLQSLHGGFQVYTNKITSEVLRSSIAGFGFSPGLLLPPRRPLVALTQDNHIEWRIGCLYL